MTNAELVYANSDLAKKEAAGAVDAVFEIMKDAGVVFVVSS